ncbi:SPOR domain-containing protein [Marinobacter daepoensis]|uniref:SPOR domain-containing protein n=1 Tax=Marinobacter daepoensis TaxID=262077 RepID=A0ABS3BG12_9GAMM|nr:SPOR domain-containing protein [Marinobacter daepoensis]MBN7770546.1 SPOR domain-containing protein [Marinobacter daepoensis]MBY6080488.1 SPOR domain-containing protein [Marinobacter daepoensis]
MARDYARKDRPSGKGAASKPAGRPRKSSKPRKSEPSHSQHGALSMKSILSLAAVGGFIGFIIYLNTLPGSPDPAPQSPAQQQQHTEPKAPPANTARQDSRPKEQNFRFYEMLPESEVVPPKVNEYTPGPAAQEFDYVVQSGSFRSKDDAERQRAQIAFQGLRAHVQRIDLESGSVWYRVNVGPFSSRSQMNSAVDKLVTINIQPLVRKIPKKG